MKSSNQILNQASVMKVGLLPLKAVGTGEEEQRHIHSDLLKHLRYDTLGALSSVAGTLLGNQKEHRI